MPEPTCTCDPVTVVLAAATRSNKHDSHCELTTARPEPETVSQPVDEIPRPTSGTSSSFALNDDAAIARKIGAPLANPNPTFSNF